MNARKGFTLTEVLVVVGILTILSAVLFPVFLRAKDSARQQASIGNLVNLGAAMIMYAQDNDDRYPLIVRSEAQAPSGWVRWPDAIATYAAGPEVFRSPNSVPQFKPWDRFKQYGAFPLAAVQGVEAFKSDNQRRGRFLGTFGVMHEGVLGYANGYRGRQYYAARHTVPSLKQVSLPQVAETALLFESNSFDANYLTFDSTTKVGWCAHWRYSGHEWLDIVGAAARYGGGERDCRNMVGSDPNPSDSIYARIANGKIPTVFADGHAKALSPREFYRSRKRQDGQAYMVYHWPHQE